MRKSNIAIIAIIIVSFILAIYLYPQMPESMASHWNGKGEVDGYMSKFWGLFLMPIVSVFVFLMFLLIPKIDPLKKNIRKFRKYFDGFIVLIIIFLFYIYILTLVWNLNYRFNMSSAIIPAIAVLFYYAGVLIENAKRNWFIGIRTPWTLSSDKVWDKTHQLGGKLFRISGGIILLSLLFPEYGLYFILMPVFFAVFYTIIYSYVEYQKVKK